MFRNGKLYIGTQGEVLKSFKDKIKTYLHKTKKIKKYKKKNENI